MLMRTLTLPSQLVLGFNYGCGLVSIAYVIHLLGCIHIDELHTVVARLKLLNGQERTRLKDLVRLCQTESLSEVITAMPIMNPLRDSDLPMPIGAFVIVPVLYRGCRHWIVAYQDHISFGVIDPWEEQETWFYEMERSEVPEWYRFPSVKDGFYDKALLIRPL